MRSLVSGASELQTTEGFLLLEEHLMSVGFGAATIVELL